MSLVLLLVGIVCIAASAFLHFRNPSPAVTIEPIPETSPVVAPAPVAKPLTEKERNLEKGRAFEEYVLQRIAALPQINLVGRNADYSKDGVYAEENTQPDLRFRKGEKPFAVECKWRRDFFKNRLEWASDIQIRNYNDFRKEKQMPVAVALGVGGTPDMPRELYLVPLSRLRFGSATQEYLQPFRITDEAALEAFLTKLLQ